MKRFISRYSLNFPKNLVYMLQVSEYRLGDFFAWYWRVADFSRVAKRKSLVKTPKAMFILISARILFLVMYLLVFVLAFSKASYNLPYLIAGLLLIPILFPYLLALLVLVINIFQLPLEYRIIAQAKKKLSKHKAYRIAIAGSYGKTTMREIIRTVISEGKKVAAAPANYNTPLGISKFISGLKGDEEVLIFEMGEYYPKDITKLCHLTNPDAGVITGVNEAHLAKFKSLERTTKTIFELADWLKDKMLYVNVEDSNILNFLNKQTNQKYLAYSRGGLADLKVSNARTSLKGTSFDLLLPGEVVSLESNLLGLHQIGPLLVSVDIALKLGLSVEQIKKGIAKTKPFEHRMQSTTDSSGVVTIDDSYNGNPTGVKAVIDFMAGIKGHQRFYVTPGLVEMGARSTEIHQEIGRLLSEAGIEKIILIRNSVTPDIYAGLQKAGYTGEVIWFDDALKAFAALSQMTVSGDLVLLQNDWPDQYI